MLGRHLRELRQRAGLTVKAAADVLEWSEPKRAAMIYQHEARGADKAITGGIDAHVQAERDQDDEGDDGSAGVLVPAG